MTRAVPLRIFALALLLVATSLAAQSRDPISHEALWMMKRVGSPAVSPDGKSVIVSVTEPSYDEKEQVSDLWLVPADGSAPPRRITATKSGESDVAWSPDSRRIAFVAKRGEDEVNQIYVMNLALGGDPVRITSVPMAARTPRWSPDGTLVAFQSSVYPGAADIESNRKLAEEIQTWLVNRMPTTENYGWYLAGGLAIVLGAFVWTRWRRVDRGDRADPEGLGGAVG